MIKVTLFLAPPLHVQPAYLPEWSHNDLNGRDALNAHPSAAISTTSERRFTSDNELALLAKSITDSFYLSSALDAGIRNPKRGDILSHDGTRWINTQVALNGGGGSGVSELSKLLDVSLGAAHSDDILAWDSITNKWTNNNDRVIYAKGKTSQTIEGNLLVTGNITAFAANGQVTTIWDSMPYATRAKVGGVRVSNVFTKGIRINDGVLEIDPDYAGGAPDLTNYYTKPESNNLFALKTSIPNLTGYATQTWVTQNVIGAAPENLNALNELATALGNDPNFATTVTSLIGTKAPINNPVFTGELGSLGNVQLLGSGSATFTAGAIICNPSGLTIEAPLGSNSVTGAKLPLLITWRGGYIQGGLKLTEGVVELMRSSLKISDANGVVQWTAQLGTNNTLEFYNTSNVLEFRLSQSGKMDVRDNVSAYSPLT